MRSILATRNRSCGLSTTPDFHMGPSLDCAMPSLAAAGRPTWPNRMFGSVASAACLDSRPCGHHVDTVDTADVVGGGRGRMRPTACGETESLWSGSAGLHDCFRAPGFSRRQRSPLSASRPAAPEHDMTRSDPWDGGSSAIGGMARATFRASPLGVSHDVIHPPPPRPPERRTQVGCDRRAHQGGGSGNGLRGRRSPKGGIGPTYRSAVQQAFSVPRSQRPRKDIRAGHVLAGRAPSPVSGLPMRWDGRAPQTSGAPGSSREAPAFPRAGRRGPWPHGLQPTRKTTLPTRALASISR